jgi:hypothetical protein
MYVYVDKKGRWLLVLILTSAFDFNIFYIR